MSNSSFTLNSAANGGAISTISSNPVITNSSFYTNTATMGGGALSNAAASPQISNNIFVGNSADAGGAISNVSSTTATITNNTFSNNTAATGGAIRNHGSPNTTISNNTFSSNSATSGDANGGAIANNSTGNLAITNNIFSANNAANGGAIYTEDSKPTISSNTFTANTATYGGAINNNGSDGIISNNSFTRQNASSGGALYVQNSINPQISNNTFIANTAVVGAAFFNLTSILTMNNSAFASNVGTNAGGAIYSSGGNITITNSSFSGNHVNSTNNAAAIHGISSSRLDLINSIVWGNEASVFVNASPSITITNSLVEGCNPAGVWGSACGNNGGNNLVDTNPLFVNPVSYTNAPTSTADLRLQVASPAVNAGNNALNTSANDLDGNPRIINGRIDLGAYETLPRLSTFVVGSGAISYTPAAEAIPVGTTLTITATASPGWSFASWSGDLSGTNAQTSLLINATKSITATFTNNPPIANAGTDQSVVAASAVTLNGSASYDADPTQTLTYAWTQTAGTSVTLTSANTAQASFIAPSAAGNLTFSLVVTDSLGLASSADTVTIIVTNAAPIADAGADQSVSAGSSVTLNGSGSSDPDGHTPLTYAWTQTSGTSVTLTGASTAYPTFTAPNVASTLTFRLIVTDGMGLDSTVDTVTITVTNDAPVANAGAVQSVVAGSSVMLDGSASNDSDGHTPLTYAWTQTGGTAVTLTGASTTNPTFTAPSVADTLTFSLIVTDSMGLASTADTVTITVTNGEPVADAGADQTVLAGASVTLDGSGSSDPDGHTPITYGWTQSGGTAVTLSDANVAQPTFTAPNVAGSLIFSLLVTDSTGLASTADTVTITVTNDAPIANAGADQSVVAGNPVTLDGSASSDPDGHTPITYGWTQSGGTPVTLTGVNTADPTFTAPNMASALTFSLVVTDSMGLASSADTVTITVTNGEPVANAGVDQAVLAGSSVTLDGSGSSDPDGHTPLTYAWTQTSGTSVTLTGASTTNPTFTAPSVADTLTFSLIVTDSRGLASTADTVTITVTNGEPVANAGADQAVLAGSSVTLDGSGSSDPDGHTPITYGWTQTGGTAVTLTGASTANPIFTAPNVASVLTFGLVVTDSMGLASTADTVTITVTAPIVPSTYQIYLPLVQHTPVESRANLIITSLSADQNGLQVQIQNTGNAATQSAFWVDLYINPSQPPSINTPWQDVAPAGAVWAVTQSLAPGESLVLTLSSSSFAAEYSVVEYKTGAQLYAIVDSYNANTSYGAISESNEQDNRFGPVSASASAKRVQPTNIPNNYNKLPAR